MNVYILSCQTQDDGGGIYKYSLTEKGLEQTKYYACDRPMYAVIDNSRLYVLLRQPFTEEESGLFSVDLELENASEIIGVNGKCACHLAVDNGDVYATNYLSGSLVKVLDKKVTHSGKGENIIRQEMPHTHCVIFSQDKKYVLCCDLGIDTLFCYDRELNEISKAKVPNGYGIRHAVLSECGKYVYVITELKPSICVFSFLNGKLDFIKEYIVPCKQQKADGAAIRLSKGGELLYASLRVENSLVVYQVDGENLRLLQKTECGGDSPRDFNLVQDKVIVTNEKSDSVVVYDLKDGLVGSKAQVINVKKPLCVVIS